LQIDLFLNARFAKEMVASTNADFEAEIYEQSADFIKADV
jgi:hypothetical protein